MRKFEAFSITELRSLQNVISCHVENIRSDVVSADGEVMSASTSDEQADKISADACLQESLLSVLLDEIEGRLACVNTGN